MAFENRFAASRSAGLFLIAALALSCKGADATGPAVESVRVTSASSVVLQVNRSQQLTALAFDVAGTALSGQAIVWTSSNSAIATVTPAGLVTAISPGTVNMTATCAGRTATVTILVQLPVATLSLLQSSATLTPGLSLQMIAAPVDVSGTALTGLDISWSSSNASVATVSNKGLVTAVATGTTTITATTAGVSGTALITVAGTQVPVASVTVKPDSIVLTASADGFKTPPLLRATLSDADGNVLNGVPVVWSSSDTLSVTVDATGQTTPNPNLGITTLATITATSEGKRGSAKFILNPRPVSAVVSPATASVAAGQSLQLTATAFDANGQPEIGVSMQWLTSTPTIAAVSATGLVTAIRAGTVTIYAVTVPEGRTGSAIITVTASAAASRAP